jgi:hypothetical protein
MLFNAETQRTQSSCHDGVVVEWAGKPGARGASGGAEEVESELRSDGQAEARPTKAVRAALGWTGRRPIPQCSDEESMSCEEVTGEKTLSEVGRGSMRYFLGARYAIKPSRAVGCVVAPFG